MEFLSIGQAINIKRSDGRIQTAVILKKNEMQHFITAEFIDNGQVKAKEIILDSLFAVNPELLQGIEQRALVDPNQQLVANALPGMLPSATYRTAAGSTLIRADHVPRPNTGLMHSLTYNNNVQLISSVGNRNSSSTVEDVNLNATSNPGVMPKTSRAKDTRRSGVVKEVDRLKDSREKRRARQAEISKEKKALMNADPGNPNWETAHMIREYQKTLDFKPLVDGQDYYVEHQIVVCVRKRPLNGKEIARKEVDVISVPCKDTLMVHEPRSKLDLTKFLEHHNFRFDYVFNDRCDNVLVYKYTAKPLVKTIFDGGMATCFAYGQTGSGKTHTMGGEFQDKVQDCKTGIYAMATKDVFSTLRSSRYRPLNLEVYASFFEIYSGKVFDLLADKHKLTVLEDAKQQVQVVGLTERAVDCEEEVLTLIQRGNKARTSGLTSANTFSSRSHAIFQIVLRPRGSKKEHGKFSFIDLAGNERGADNSTADRQTRMEGAEINKSLLALKECIRALGRQSSHLPFRGSTLTQVLRDSFVGANSKTCMIAMISPGVNSCEHTLNTLRYADRVKELVAKETAHVSTSDAVQIIEQDKDDEIAQCSLNERDLSDNLSVTASLRKGAEKLIAQHSAVNEYISRFLQGSVRLHNLTDSVEYDQEVYFQQGKAIFSRLAEVATSCRDSFSDVLGTLQQEQEALKPHRRCQN